MSVTTGGPGLAEGLRAGLRLEAVSIAWMVAEATVSVGAGLAAGSLLLVAFGVDSVIEMISAALLFWRLRRQALGLWKPWNGKSRGPLGSCCMPSALMSPPRPRGG